MSDFNRVFIMGRLGADPELKETKEGSIYVNLSVATHQGRGDQRTTHWHRVAVFGNQAKVCSEYLKKGSGVLIEGSLEVRTFESKEGKKTYKQVSILAQRVQFLNSSHLALQEVSFFTSQRNESVVTA